MIVVAMLLAFGCVAAVSCKPEEVDPGHDFNEDTLGLEFSDSIIVKFGDLRWTTKSYTSLFEHDEMWDHNWIYVDCHKPGSAYPRVKMKFFEGEGSHSAQMTINYNEAVGYSIPGELYGDGQCGYALYYEEGEVSSPDGTSTSDWRPMEITMEVLKYVDSTHLTTAYIHGTMFNYGSWYRSWVEGAPLDIDSVETRTFSITFGDLPITPAEQ